MIKYYLSFFTHKSFLKNPAKILLRIVYLIGILISNKIINISIKSGDSFYKIKASNLKKNQGGRSLIIFKEASDGFLQYGHNLLDESDVVIDGGANQGIYSCLISKNIGETGQVISIEPLETPLKMLTENIKINNFKNIKIVKCGLSNKNIFGKIYYNRNEFGQATILPNPTNLTNDTEYQLIKLQTIDTLVKRLKLNKINFIKLDLQNAELIALEGAVKTIKNFKPGFYLECNQKKFNEIKNKLNKYKYSSYMINDEGDLQFINKIENECNVLFLQKEKAVHYTAKLLIERYNKNPIHKIKNIFKFILKFFFLIKTNSILFNKKIYKFDIIKNSKSQINQDLFVIAALNFKKKGFFIEIGAADGLNLSNSYLLEKKFNWNGILCEPSTIYKKLIKKNRKSKIETKCIYNRNTKIKFLETAYPMLSTMKSFIFSDHHKKLRNELINHNCIKETISVNKFLQKHNCPINIDYLSIDTEGSEYLILKNFNLKKYNIKIITIEHNFTSNRKKIQNYLFKNNYLLVKINTQHDDWYIKKEIYNKISSKLKDKIIYSDFIYRH